MFLDRIRHALKKKRRRPNYQFGVLFLDLDGFKIVNDSLGHLAGDRLLTHIAHRINADLRDVDTAARFGGDEFAILIDGIADPDTLITIAQRLQHVIAQPHTTAGQELVVTASIGIAASTNPYRNAEDLLRDPDIPLYPSETTNQGTQTNFH